MNAKLWNAIHAYDLSVKCTSRDRNKPISASSSVAGGLSAIFSHKLILVNTSRHGIFTYVLVKMVKRWSWGTCNANKETTVTSRTVEWQVSVYRGARHVTRSVDFESQRDGLRVESGHRLREDIDGSGTRHPVVDQWHLTCRAKGRRK